jgi:hypothetical protein
MSYGAEFTHLGATCRAVVHALTRRRRGTKLGAKIYGAELEYITTKLV